VLRITLLLFILYCIPLIVGNNQAQAFFFVQEEKESSEEAETPTDEKKLPAKSMQRSDIKIVKPISIFEQQKSDLTHYFAKDKVQKLTAGTNEYIMIEDVSATENNKGVAILLPDWQQGLAQSKAINTLRKNLPLHGWATMSIQSPNKPNGYPSSARINKELIEQNAKALMLYQNELKSLITAAMNKAKSYPGIILVISKGSQAAMLVNLYKNNPDLLPAALVTLSAGMYSPIENELFAKNMATSALPILDLVLKRGNKLVLENALLRKKYATKEMKVYYRQKHINTTALGHYPERTLLIEINGWLKTIGW